MLTSDYSLSSTRREGGTVSSYSVIFEIYIQMIA